MRILVTGAGGFVGRHVVRDLAGSGHKALAFDVNFAAQVEGASGSFTGDLTDAAAMKKIVEEAAPDACVHLAAISFVPDGEARPEAMLQVNIMGTVNVLQALRAWNPACRVLVASTAAVYGGDGGDVALDEDAPVKPASLYAASKAAAEVMALAYARRYGMNVIVARPNNHTGPGQSSRFVVPSFARQVKAIARGEAEPVLKVGNLDSERDFMDVRDVVRAYRLLLEKGRAGEVYNISASQRIRIGDLLKELCRLAGVSPRIEVDDAKFRPADRSPLLDTGKLHRETGWAPEIEFPVTLRDILAEL